MSIAITNDHKALAGVVADFLIKHEAREAGRALLESPVEERPAFWEDFAGLGWLGLHVPEEFGGSGYGLEELVAVVEQLGRALAPGPFTPTVIASAALVAMGNKEVQAKLLPGLVDGRRTGAVALRGAVDVHGGEASGSAGVVLGGALADVLLIASGDDVVVVEATARGLEVTAPRNLDPTRRSARVTLEGAPATVLPGATRVLRDVARVVLAAEAVGVARECTTLAAEYAKNRVQFGRPIAMFQAVKHHCANMLVATELATAAVWDAARAATAADNEQLGYTAAVAAALAGPAADLCANLNTQVHGGIAYTFEHDAHLFMRRATALRSLLDPDAAAADVTDLTRRGITRAQTVDLPPEAEPIRNEVRVFAQSLKDLETDAQRERLVESGYAMPHWPKPWGRDADAVEQLVIEQEFADAGIRRPSYSITGWVILTLIQHATENQIARWVPPALRQEVIWCQLFSEPDAGSDAAGIKTRATRVNGGWVVNGQKVWTSGAHYSGMGLATVRTDPIAPKHNGITTMVIDIHAPGVEVRPIKMPTGNSEFNEVFFTDVFVSDDDVVGPVNGGWTVARATLGNESVSIGGGQGGEGGGRSLSMSAFLAPFDANPSRLPGGAARIGRFFATTQALATLNLRSAHRAVGGGEPGPEGSIAKLVLAENGHEAAAIQSALAGDDATLLEGAGAMAGMLTLSHRVMSIAGGTSEIKRSQIAERILGLPRDPLLN